MGLEGLVSEYIGSLMREAAIASGSASSVIALFGWVSNAENMARIGQSIGNFSGRVSRGIALAYKNYVGGIFTK